VGTTLFLLLGIQAASAAAGAAGRAGMAGGPGNVLSARLEGVVLLATSIGLSLLEILVSAWSFYRAVGGLFSPHILFVAFFLLGFIF
jgi:hypothetical protein